MPVSESDALKALLEAVLTAPPQEARALARKARRLMRSPRALRQFVAQLEQQGDDDEDDFPVRATGRAD